MLKRLSTLALLVLLATASVGQEPRPEEDVGRATQVKAVALRSFAK
jgi:hypothetical protein